MIVVFLGPTLSVAAAREELDATYLPPASQGDIYRASRRGATAVGLIDGYFHRVPSVWHKEILWALSEGILVYGAASMGALRAAELAPFGMVGVGKIFDAFCSGELTDDDEVALSHSDANSAYLALSEAMVDIRATLTRAESERVISHSSHEMLLMTAKRFHYTERLYPSILKAAEPALPEADRHAFSEWWPRGRVRQKRADAVLMLQQMRTDLESSSHPRSVSFWFERTALWEELTRRAVDLDEFGRTSAEAEARARAGAFVEPSDNHIRDAVLARVLALDEAKRQSFSVNEETLVRAIIRFREERGLVEPEHLERWMEENGLAREGFLRLMMDEARLDWVRAVLRPEVDAMLADYVRVKSTEKFSVDIRKREG